MDDRNEIGNEISAQSISLLLTTNRNMENVMSDEDNKQESDISTCRLCEKLVVRRYVGKFPNGRDKMYVDEDGKLWSGRKCPKCQADKARNNMRRLRKNNE